MKKNHVVLALIIISALVPCIVHDSYYLHICILAFVYIMLTQGLNLLSGYVGQLSLGHQTFLGIGGYTSALLAIYSGMPVLLAILVAGLFSAVCSYFIGLITFRTRGSYFVIMTTAFAEIVRLVINNSEGITNGPMGLRGIPSPVIFGYLIKTKAAYYYLGLFLAVVTVYVCYRIVDSRTGRAFVALREQEALAKSVGISFTKYALIAAVIGGFFAGIAGGYYAHYAHFISTDVLTFNYTVTMLLMMVIGGKGTIMGPVIGSVLFSFIPEFLRAYDDFRLPIYGVILIVSVLFMPQGLMPILLKLWDKIFLHKNNGQKRKDVAMVGEGRK